MTDPKPGPTRKAPRSAQGADTPAPDVSTNAPLARKGGDLEGFIWQQLNDIQAKLGGLAESARHQAAEISKLDEKLDQQRDKIHTINISIAVAAAVFAVVAAIGGFVLKEVWDTLKPTVVERLKSDPTPAPAQPSPQPQPQPQPKKQ